MTRTGLKNSLCSTALALLMASFALTAIAHPPGDGWQKGEGKPFRQQMRRHLQDRINTMDTDSDGQISFDEFKAPKQDRFSKFDLNGDGDLTLDEMKESIVQEANKRLENRFARMDGDANGIVTRDEIRQHIFDRMDRDGDGYLTGRELRPAGPEGHRRGRPEFEGS